MTKNYIQKFLATLFLPAILQQPMIFFPVKMNVKNILFDFHITFFQVIMESIEKGDDDAGLKSLIDLAESTPKFLRPQLDQLIAACINVYKSTNQVN